MGIKIGKESATEVKYDGADVKQIILDDSIVWCKPFIYTQGTLPTGVASLTCTRSSTDEPSASTGTISDNGAIFYGDKLYWSAIPSAGYAVSVVHDSSNKVTVSDNITGVNASGVAAVRTTWNMAVTMADYVTGWRYKIDSGSWVNKTASFTISGIDCASKVTIECTSNQGTAGYSYGAYQGAGTFGSGDQISDLATTLSCSRTRITWSYTINLGAGQTSYKYKIDSGSYVTKTANYTVTGIDYASTLTIVGVSADTGYVANTSTYSRTYSHAGGSVTVSASRIAGTISQGTLPTGVASITCYRKAWDGSSFSAYTGSTIYYGDQFYWTATASTGYNDPTLTYGSSSSIYTWTGSNGGSITSVDTSGLVAGSRKSYTIILAKATNHDFFAWKDGSTTVTSMTAYYGDIISTSGNVVTCKKWDATSTNRWQVTAVATADTTQYSYSTPTIIGGSIDSVTAAATITGSNNRTTNSYTITWKYLSAYPSTWATTTESYSYGATPSRSDPGNVTDSAGTSRQRSDNWNSLAAVTEDRTITRIYTQQHYITLSGTRCSAEYSSGWYNHSNDSFSCTWSADTNCGFDSSGTDTASETISLSQAGSYSKTAGYIKVKITNGTGCSADKSTGYNEYNTLCTWTRSSGYAFDSSGKTTASERLTTPGATYTKSCTHAYYSLSLTNCSYYSEENAGWKAVGATPATTVVANSGWSFGGSSIGDTARIGGDTAVPCTKSASPSYCKIKVTGSNCTITVGSTSRASGWEGIVANGTTITWAANSGYAFSSSGTNNYSLTVSGPGNYEAAPSHAYYGLSLTNCSRYSGDTAGWYAANAKPSTTVKASSGWSFGGSSTQDSISIGGNSLPNTASASPGYCDITVESGTGCVANVSSGIVANGTQITWSASTGYAFDVYGTTSDSTTVSGPAPYSKSATHGKYTLSLTNCEYSSGNNTGWYALNSKPSTTVIANTNWSFNGSATKDTKPIGGSATVPCTVSASPGYCNITVSSTNCEADVSSGIVANNTTITWTRTSGYAFNNSGKTTDTATVSGPGNYSNSANFAYLTISGSNRSVTENGAGWYAAGASITTTFKANSGWSFNGSATEDTTTKTTAVPGTNSATPSYFYLTISSGTGVSNVSATSGLYTSSTKPSSITWTCSSGYAFDSSGTNTTSETPSSAPGSYSKSATHAYYTLNLTNCVIDSSASYKDPAGWYAVNTKPKTTVKANSGWSFNGSAAQDTTTVGGDTAVPCTKSASPSYFYITVSGTNCSANASSGFYTSSTKPSSIEWTPSTYYSFDAGSTQTTYTNSSISSAPASYSAEPTYIRAASIATGDYNSSVNKNATTYYAPNTVVTWTAGSNYSYGGNNRQDTTTNGDTVITAGANIAAPNPGYVYCTLKALYCNMYGRDTNVGVTWRSTYTSALSSSGLIAVGTEIYCTSFGNWTSYEESSSVDTPVNAPSETVTLGKTLYSKEYNYSLFTSYWNSSGNPTTLVSPEYGYRLIGSDIVIQGNILDDGVTLIAFGANSPYLDPDESARTTTIKIDPYTQSYSSHLLRKTTVVYKKISLTVNDENIQYAYVDGDTATHISNGTHWVRLKSYSNLDTAAYNYVEDYSKIYFVFADTPANTSYTIYWDNRYEGSRSKPSSNNSGWNYYYFWGNSTQTQSFVPTTTYIVYSTFSGTRCTAVYNEGHVPTTTTSRMSNGWYLANKKFYWITYDFTNNVWYDYALGYSLNSSTDKLVGEYYRLVTAEPGENTMTAPYGIIDIDCGTGTLSPRPANAQDIGGDAYYFDTPSATAKNITVYADSRHSFGGTQAGDSITASTTVPGSITALTPYNYITVYGSNCEKINVQGVGDLHDGDSCFATNRLDKSVGYEAKITWYADDTHAFNEAGTTWTKVDYVTYSKSTYSQDALYTRKVTVTWKYLSAYNDQWTTVEETYNAGETPSRAAPDNQTSGNSRKTFTGWDDTSAVYDNRTITAQYKTQYNITVNCTNCTADTESGWVDNGAVIEYISATDYAFDSSGTTWITSKVNSAGSYDKSADYYNITIVSDRCSCDTSSGYQKIGNTITWTRDSGYAFSSSGATTATATIQAGTNTYRKSANYKNITVSSSNCSANVSSGWVALTTTITWTASSGYAFNSSGSTTTTATVSTSSASYSASAGYFYVSISSTNTTVWLSTSDSSTSGSTTSGWYNSTVYGFSKLKSFVSGMSGTLISGSTWSPNAIYRVDSASGPKTISASATIPSGILLGFSSSDGYTMNKSYGSHSGWSAYYSTPYSLNAPGSLSASSSGQWQQYTNSIAFRLNGAATGSWTCGYWGTVKFSLYRVSSSGSQSTILNNVSYSSVSATLSNGYLWVLIANESSTVKLSAPSCSYDYDSAADIKVTNTNSTTVTVYIDGVSKGTLASGSSKWYTVDSFYTYYNVQFKASGYGDSDVTSAYSGYYESSDDS